MPNKNQNRYPTEIQTRTDSLHVNRAVLQTWWYMVQPGLMKEPADPIDVAKLLKELWPDAKRIEFREGESTEDHREGLSFFIDRAGCDDDPMLPMTLPYTNPKWPDETQAALLWVWRYHRKPGATWPKIAKGIGMEVRQLRRYFNKADPPEISQDTINKIWDFKKRIEP